MDPSRMPTAETVRQFADQLRQYATHFEQRDWDYTRRHDIKAIRHRGAWRGYDHPLRRIKRWLDDYFTRPAAWEREFGMAGFAWRHPIIHARVSLGTDANLPDGVLDGGGVITHWEETGEYLQYVQPSVGAMFADWMEAEPDSPHALRIAGEMKRINDRYGKRVADEDGQAA